MTEAERERRRAYMREYRQKHLQRILEYNRRYYWEHKEKQLAYGKAYREKIKANMTEKDIEERRLYHRTMYHLYKEKGI